MKLHRLHRNARLVRSDGPEDAVGEEALCHSPVVFVSWGMGVAAGWLPGGYGMAMRGRIAHASGRASLRGPGAGRTRGPWGHGRADMVGRWYEDDMKMCKYV